MKEIVSFCADLLRAMEKEDGFCNEQIDWVATYLVNYVGRENFEALEKELQE